MSKEENLTKKIEERAKIFKSRAARSPNDLKRHDQILADEAEAMQVAHNQLHWSIAKIGSAFGRSSAAVKDKLFEIEKSDTCSASPENVDIAAIKQWGVPAKNAPEILLNWRSYHKDGKHKFCQLYANLKEDLMTRNIPFNKAEIILTEAIWAEKNNVPRIHEDHDAARALRPWESSKQREAFYREIQQPNKPTVKSRKKNPPVV